MLDLLFKHFRGQATAGDKDAIGAWLEEDAPAHTRIYKDARFVYEASLLYSDPAAAAEAARNREQNAASAQAATTAARRTAASSRTARQTGRPAVRRILWYAGGIAASLLLVAGAAFLGNRRTLDTLAQQTSVFETPAGQRARTVLPDGTEIWLNAESKLEYPPIFTKKERRVKLSGEAVFEVTHDPKHPFVVETFATDIEVLGTRFNVLADEAAGRFSATLIRGSVKVTNRRDRTDCIILQPRQMVNMENNRLTLALPSNPDDLSWIDGKVNFGGQNFRQLMRTFERAFGVKIVVASDKIPDTVWQRGKVRVSDGIDHALSVLQHTVAFRYVKDGESGTVTITDP